MQSFLLVISEVGLKPECTTKTKMTNPMKTSCAALDRLLNPDNDSLTLSMLEISTVALGKKTKYLDNLTVTDQYI